MGKKRWYTRGLQVQLLLVILCFVQHVLAKPTPPISSKKGKASAVAKASGSTSTKTAKPHTVSQPATASSAKKDKENNKAKTDKRRATTKSGKHSSSELAKAPKTQVVTKSAAVASAKKGRTPAKFQSAARRVVVTSVRKGKRKTFVTAAAASAVKRGGRRVRVQSIIPAVSKGTTYRTTATPAALAMRKRTEPAVPLEPESSLSQTDGTYVSIPHSYIGFSPEKAPFVAQLNAERLAYRINSIFVLPAEECILEVEGSSRRKNEYQLRTALDATQIGPNKWHWQAPQEVGLYPVKILHPKWGATILLNVFVMIPYDQLDKEYLNGYRIGNYPPIPLRQLPIYNPPRGFIEVTRTNENVLLSPHFSLQQFLCKQDGGYPKYLVLDRQLLLALEFILEKANERGYHCRTFEVMSGYRTPYYNRAIGNSTTYSRHLWGDAADIFIDEAPHDGEMDDLNRDGVIDFQDAAVLYHIIDGVYESRIQRLLTGGLARYKETSFHGPFVHVDVRGFYTRWGR